MDYFRILNLKKEPFSNSPEPEFFFQSSKHLGCLQKLELAVRLRRGLNVVIGDVGTGKTTLCRQLILKFAESEHDSGNTETHLLMDPAFTNPGEFLSAVALTLGISFSGNSESEWQVKENIKKYLLEKGVDEGKIVVLIIDEGQKLPDFCLEILREFLNYETNEYKLLQIVILAQREFEQTLKRHKNFADRVNLYYFLEPLNFRETCGMVRFRIEKAGNTGETPSLFTYPGLFALYLATHGYPRKIVTLCHQVILALIIQNRSKAGWFMVRSCAGRVSIRQGKGFRLLIAASLTALFLIIVAAGLFYGKISDSKPVKEIPDTAPGIVKEKESSSGMQPQNIPLPEAVAATVQELPVAKIMPDSLGKLTVKGGRTVWWMLKDFYGEFDDGQYKEVVLANPHIKNLSKVYAGEVVNLPALPARSNPLPAGKYMVRVAAGENIEEIYELYRKHKELLPALRFLSYWNSREGLVFAVFLKDGYNNMESAGNTAGKLPEPLASNAGVFEKSDDDTVFFTNW
ncbi:MAG: AAA family ATPase [Desulfobacterales bacterium]|nr:AAA family ATPase [Desulfobacterales bacterium]